MRPAVAVATSGGRDSTALLHATATAGAALGIDVHALHVHHGLQPEADHWWRHVAAQCRRWRARGLPVGFHGTRLTGAPTAGESIEAWARRGRYAALVAMANQVGCSLVLLAHHRADQAETFLLQALRGAGPAGLASMPAAIRRHGIVWARPWLDRPRTEIDAYLRRHRLRWVEDPSNAQTRHARSRLRSAVMPALASAFPEAEAGLIGAVRRAQEAADCLGEVAAQDLAAIAEDDELVVTRWIDFSPARRANVLRHWLAHRLPGGAPESLVQRLLSELPAARAARWPAGADELRLHRGRLTIEAAAAAVDGPACWADLSRPGEHPIDGWQGRFVVQAAREGVPAERLATAQLRPRQGGESFQRAPRSLPRSLKKQFQAAGLAAWQRGGPLVFDAAGRLLFVPGLGLDARCVESGAARLVQLEWRPGLA